MEVFMHKWEKIYTMVIIDKDFGREHLKSDYLQYDIKLNRTKV